MAKLGDCQKVSCRGFSHHVNHSFCPSCSKILKEWENAKYNQMELELENDVLATGKKDSGRVQSRTTK
jgi:hypothetical protein